MGSVEARQGPDHGSSARSHHYAMIDQPSSGLHISAESSAFSPFSTLPPLLLCAGLKEGAAAKLDYLGELPGAEPTVLAHLARLFNKTRDSSSE